MAEENKFTKLNSYTFANDNILYGATIDDKINYSSLVWCGKMQNMMPAIVREVYPETNEVGVQIAINAKFPQNGERERWKSVEYPIIRVSVKQPLSNLGANGGVGIIFPIREGDRGWLKAADKDSREYKEQEDKTVPSDPQWSFAGAMYEFGYFEPDVMSNDYTVAEEDSGSLVITVSSGKSKITINPDTNEIIISSDNKITVNAPLTNIIGDVNITGNLTASVDVVGGSVSLKEHTHGGVQTGGGNTGVPN